MQINAKDCIFQTHFFFSWNLCKLNNIRVTKKEVAGRDKSDWYNGHLGDPGSMESQKAQNNGKPCHWFSFTIHTVA